MPLHDRLDQPLQVLLAAGVRRDGLGPVRIASVDALGLCVEAFLLAARQHDVGALLGEGLRDGAADAPAGPGD